MLTPDRAVLDANLAFYDAFSSQDLAAMNRVWSAHNPVACIHPGWQVIHGRQRVMESWRAIFESSGASPLRCESARAVVLDQTGYVTCVERLVDSQLQATNMFVLESGLWRMVVHHAGPFAPQNFPGDVRPPRGRLN